MRHVLACAFYCVMGIVFNPSVRAGAATPLIAAADWNAYKQKFLDPSGRIVDDGNGNISHSEGQGYGLLLAYLAENRSDFELIWSFTRTELLLRNDHLAVWKWDPAASPHVTDVNNAADGDILIAYALARAGKEWGEPDLVDSATEIVKAISANVVYQHEGRRLILPGASGFSAKDREDGPVINISYWIFEAFPVFAELDPQTGWDGIARDGLNLVALSLIGPKRLPPDWLSLKADSKPAKGFPPEFGYNALRVPLYLLRSGVTDPGLLDPFAEMNAAGAVDITDVETGEGRQALTDPGYRIITALAACATKGTPVPAALKSFAPTLYYPSTLHLLGLAYIAERQGGCR
ncbi:glycosyl hydrolase family 8 [Mesorhizobium sp. BAC0120]|uniref:glycosyl hydrolase family 8 n=1 Tax=Mesorhizobium sp. BAC0120 TaxID=3090670 RepID=UPI00298C3EC0|nr:glycosyl hydrolase family 8 [Mesorhizobium sp. BAC0120]MDW6023487.1 glycosyl hydrolase family 8 [Mesorhizobium sp. BAC0120]